MTRSINASAVVITGCLVAASCGSGDQGASAATSSASAASTTEKTETTTETTEPAVENTTTPSTVATTEAPSTTEGPDASAEPDEPAVPTITTTPDGQVVLDFEFQPVPPGDYFVETIGAPFTISIPDGWFVQPNSDAQFVITDPDSIGPGDRDIVMLRPSNLADPTKPAAPVEEQDGDWPLADIEGWLDALIPGVVEGAFESTTLGGLDATRFDVSLSDEVACGPQFCVGFATNRQVNGMWFDRRTGYRVWWIDGGEQSPIAVFIGDGSDPEFTERAEAVLATVAFESVGPNPIPADADLWELGFATTVPAGIVMLPVGPGVTFEMSAQYDIRQDEFTAALLPDAEWEVDIFFPQRSVDGEPVETVEDVIAALETREGTTVETVGTRMVDRFEATEAQISGPPLGPNSAPVFPNELNSDTGWRAPPEGTLWIMETPDGVAVVTAEAFAAATLDEARALAEEILDSIVIGG